MPGSAAIGNLAVNLSLETAAFTDGATKAQVQMRALSASANNMAGGFKSFGLSAGNARIVGLELTHVTRALGEQIAMGVSPARAFASEIGRIATAAQYAGGIGGLGRVILGLVAPFASVAAGAGILATAFLGVKQAADDTDLNAYIATLGLTDAQIKRLKDTTVTWGDVTKATFQVMAEKAGTSSSAISGFFSKAFTSVGEFGKFSASIVLAAFGAAVKGVYSLFANLPGIVGNAAVGAANLAISAMEFLVNKAVGALNGLIEGANKVPFVEIQKLADVSLGRIRGSFKGSFAQIGADVSSTFHGIFNSTEKTFDQISARAVQLREKDLAQQAAAMKSSDAADKAAKGHEARAKAMKHEADEADNLTKNLDALLNKKADIDSDLTNPKPLAKIELPEFTKPLEKAKSAWEDWASTVPQQAADIAEAFRGIAFRGFDSISSAIGDVISGARSLKDAFADVAKSIISNLVAMAAKMLIFRLVSGLFGGQSASFNADMSKIIASNSAALGVNMPGMANGGSGVFGGFGGVDRNILSLNGSPIARVSKGEPFSVGAANNNGITINQTIAPNFAGNAATRDDLVRMGIITKNAAVQAIREERRRA